VESRVGVPRFRGVGGLGLAMRIGLFMRSSTVAARHRLLTIASPHTAALRLAMRVCGIDRLLVGQASARHQAPEDGRVWTCLALCAGHPRPRNFRGRDSDDRGGATLRQSRCSTRPGLQRAERALNTRPPKPLVMRLRGRPPAFTAGTIRGNLFSPRARAFRCAVPISPCGVDGLIMRIERSLSALKSSAPPLEQRGAGSNHTGVGLPD
jgi:hypothetical protein